MSLHFQTQVEKFQAEAQHNFQNFQQFQAEQAHQAQQPYQIPTLPYYLALTNFPLEDINLFTNILNSSNNYKDQLISRLSSRNWPTTIGIFDAPKNVDAVKIIIGEDGCFLKLTTENCNVDMIWHDRQFNRFIFWGPSQYSVIQAMHKIRIRIIKYTTMPLPAKTN